jgi:hypothetical protein
MTAKTSRVPLDGLRLAETALQPALEIAREKNATVVHSPDSRRQRARRGAVPAVAKEFSHV